MAKTTKGGDTTTRKPGRGAEKAGDPGLITRIERAARSIGVKLPTDQLRDIRDQARGEVETPATEAAGYLGSDRRAQGAAGIIIVLVDERGEMVSKREFGRRPRKG